MSNDSNRMGQLFVVSAPSGAGKTSLVKALIESEMDISVSVSHTTRAVRPGEVDGVNYHFISQPEFFDLRESGGFFESAEVFGNFYGTSKQSVTHQLSLGGDVILEIDWQGAQQIKRQVETAISIFILPPSTAALRERLRGRGQDDDSTIERRMHAARDEMSHYHEADFVVLNDHFDNALADLSAIVRSQRLTRDAQSMQLTAVISDLLGI